MGGGTKIAVFPRAAHRCGRRLSHRQSQGFLFKVGESITHLATAPVDVHLVEEDVGFVVGKDQNLKYLVEVCVTPFLALFLLKIHHIGVHVERLYTVVEQDGAEDCVQEATLRSQLSCP